MIIVIIARSGVDRKPMWITFTYLFLWLLLLWVLTEFVVLT